MSNLPGIQIYAADEARARTWLADESVQAALVRLLAAPDAPGACELYVQPERLWFRARLRRKTEGEIACLGGGRAAQLVGIGPRRGALREKVKAWSSVHVALKVKCLPRGHSGLAMPSICGIIDAHRCLALCDARRVRQVASPQSARQL